MLRYGVLLAIPVVALTQTCPPLNNTNPDPLLINSRLDGHQVSHLMGFELKRCVLECFLLKLCVSFNFRERLGVCELNRATVAEADPADVKDEADFVHYDLEAWSGQQAMAGTCASKPCAENQRCINTWPSYTCADVDCGPPPKFLLRRDQDLIHMTSSTDVTSVGSRAHYSCNNPWYFLNRAANNKSPFYKYHWKLCNSDYRWSKNAPTCQSSLMTCKAIKSCNPGYTDGHYWIHKAGYVNNKVKVYCHDMTTNTPLTFISLPHSDNIANDEGNGTNDATTTTFQKIQVTGSYTTTVARSNYMFATTTGPAGDQEFGKAGSCHGDGITTPKVYGLFKINLTGTGLKLKTPFNVNLYDVDVTSECVLNTINGNEWASISSDSLLKEKTSWTSDPIGASELVIHTSTKKEVRGNCWGNCGSCDPSSNLELGFDPNDDVDRTGVISPICV